MNEKRFNRVEKKYVITQAQKDLILSKIKPKMHEDAYYKSQVFNIYFDTDNFDLIIKSIERPKFKEKLRARSYAGYDKVFLEIKTKMKGKDYNLGYKRRVLITTKDYQDFISGKSNLITLAEKSQETPADIQIAHEVDYMIKHFDLKPQILVYYDRSSYVGEDGVRITFDENLSYRNNDLIFQSKGKDKKYFNDKKNIIMELKAHGVIPLWLAHILSEAKAYPQSFSKIGNIYKQIRKEQNV